ncbi:MAG: carboxylate-amine ligase [Acidimicrobiia bacterium]
MPRPAFTIGIEEEYLMVDRVTRDLVPDLPKGFFDDCEQALGPQVAHEFMRSQLEVGTKVSRTVQEAQADLALLRSTIAELALEYGVAPISASTHPFASHGAQQHTDKTRYNALAESMGAVVRRLLISGMHVHVAIEDRDLRIDLMNQVLYFLPHLLALSTSSPFWEGDVTGLKSYRTSVFRALPRTGLPDEFHSWADYERHIGTLTNAGVIEDATRLWWDLRPSARYPTLEMRSSDICTRLDDGITIAALYLSLLAMLYRRRLGNQRWRTYSRMLINENIWRAQRYGMDEGLIDFGRGAVVPFADLVDEVIELVREDADELGCLDEVLGARDIVTRGTSAHRQVRVYEEAVAAGANTQEALIAVVDFLIEETVRGL